MKAAHGLALVFIGSLAHAHPFHVTKAELFHQGEEDELLVSLFIAHDDLTSALGPTSSAKQRQAYVLRHVQVVGPNQATLSPRWKAEVSESTGVWFYWQYPNVSNLEALVLRYTLLRETEPMALHTVEVVQSDGASHVLSFHHKQTRQPLARPKANDQE